MRCLKQNITQSPENIIIHGVNCQGVMGSGVALALRQEFPVIYDEYIKHIADYGPDELYEILGSTNWVNIGRNKFVVNVFSQRYYGSDGAVYADENGIIESLKRISKASKNMNYSVASVKIGCGLGGLSWEDTVEPIFEQYLPNATIYDLG